MHNKIFLPIIIFVLVISVALAIGGCSDIKYYEQDSEPSSTKLRFYWNWADSGNKSVTLNEIIDNFLNHNPNITIESEYSGDDTFYQKLQIDFATHNAPDIISMQPGNIIYNLIDNNQLADLSYLYTENPNLRITIKESSSMELTRNEKIYGLPLEERYIMLYINTDIFKFCEADIPSDFSELYTAVEKIKAKGITPIAYCASDSSLLYQVIINSLSSDENFSSFNDENAANVYSGALDELKYLYEIGAFSDNCLTTTPYEQNLLFINKQAAMIVQDSSFPGVIDAMQKINTSISDSDNTVGSFNAVEFPVKTTTYIAGIPSNQKSYIKGLGDATFYASADAFENKAKKDAISSLFLHLTDEKNLSLLTRNAKFIPSTTTVLDSEYYNSLITQMNLQIMDALSINDMPELIFPESIWNSEIITKIPSMLVGNITSEEIINNIKQSY